MRSLRRRRGTLFPTGPPNPERIANYVYQSQLQRWAWPERLRADLTWRKR
jgi:hypothetical protein